MILNEIFKNAAQLEEIPARSLHMHDIVAAYSLNYNNERYIFYFDDCGKNGVYGYGFGPDNSDGGVKHALTNYGKPFPIINAMIQSLLKFITDKSPESVSFKGHELKQEQFYLKIIPYLRKRLPEQYHLALEKPELRRIIITRIPKEKWPSYWADYDEVSA